MTSTEQTILRGSGELTDDDRLAAFLGGSDPSSTSQDSAAGLF